MCVCVCACARACERRERICKWARKYYTFFTLESLRVEKDFWTGKQLKKMATKWDIKDLGGNQKKNNKNKSIVKLIRRIRIAVLRV